MYQWVLWFHVISMVSWFAVLFYLPRLFVYHAENADNSGFIEVVKVMEMKIYKYIGVPAALLRRYPDRLLLLPWASSPKAPGRQPHKKREVLSLLQRSADDPAAFDRRNGGRQTFLNLLQAPINQFDTGFWQLQSCFPQT